MIKWKTVMTACFQGMRFEGNQIFSLLFFFFNTMSLAGLQSFHTVLINQLGNENATT